VDVAAQPHTDADPDADRDPDGHSVAQPAEPAAE